MESKRLAWCVYRTFIVLATLSLLFFLVYHFQKFKASAFSSFSPSLLSEEPKMLPVSIFAACISSFIFEEFIYLIYPHFPRLKLFAVLLIVFTVYIGLAYHTIFLMSI